MVGKNEYAVASELRISIGSPNDIADVLMASLRHGGLMVTASELCPEFFDLRTGLAGEALQKFANYRARVAMVVDQPDSHSEHFRELMREHRTHPLVRFFTSIGDAEMWLQG